jgi:transcriptional regulator with XRE-family HTH domain
MLTPKLVDEIRQMLAEKKYSQRKVARIAGVSRGTVGAIVSGKRQDRKKVESPWDKDLEEPEGPAERCPGCGGMVYMPCRLCLVRKYLADNPRPAPDERKFKIEDPPGLNLRSEHRARFNQVLAWRRIQAMVEQQ